MSITIVQKSDLSAARPDARRALVLAGGAISGGAFKIGGLLALNRYFSNFQVTSFDIYVGISAGAFLAAPLSAGFSPRELMMTLRGGSKRLTQFKPSDFYWPNTEEFVTCPARLMRDLALAGPRATATFVRMMPSQRSELTQRCKDFLAEPGLESAERVAQLFFQAAAPRFGLTGGYLPSGIFDNRRIESYLRANMAANDLPNDFRQLKLLTGKSLYIGATNLNTAQNVVFGHDEDHSVTISQAVQASTAIPVFFRPARIGQPGREQDYCDGALRKTANISTAVRHGAELIVCYNPFRPFTNYGYRPSAIERRSIGDLGAAVIINQAFRTLLHSRLRLGIEKLRLDTSFRGDCILIEPAETDSRFFSINPLAFWQRGVAAEHGYASTKRSLEKHHEQLRTIFNAYGLRVSLDGLQDEWAAIETAGTDREKLDVLQRREPEPRRRARLRLVSGVRR